MNSNSLILTTLLGLVILAGCAMVSPAPSLVHTFVVKDEQGKPIPGALVQTENLWGSIDNSARPTCTTDNTGTCRFQPMHSKFVGSNGAPAYTTVMVKIKKEGYLPKTVFDTQKDDRVDFYGPKSYLNEGLNIVLKTGQKSVQFVFHCRDLRNKQLSGVSMSASIDNYGASAQCITDSTGSCIAMVDIVIKDSLEFNTTAEASAPGRYTKKLTKLTNYHDEVVKYEFTLDQPLDYLCDDLKEPEALPFAKHMIAWVDTLRANAIIQDIVVTHGNFCISTFRNKKYAAVKLDHTSVHNSLKLSNDQIGIKMFDEVVRKILNVVAPAVSTLPMDGYYFMIQTAAGDPSKKYADKKILAYRFYLPKQAVRQYNDKVLTGQQLIDASVVLLNNERIDLKLQ